MCWLLLLYNRIHSRCSIVRVHAAEGDLFTWCMAGFGHAPSHRRADSTMYSRLRDTVRSAAQFRFSEVCMAGARVPVRVGSRAVGAPHRFLAYAAGFVVAAPEVLGLRLAARRNLSLARRKDSSWGATLCWPCHSSAVSPDGGRAGLAGLHDGNARQRVDALADPHPHHLSSPLHQSPHHPLPQRCPQCLLLAAWRIVRLPK